MVRDRPDTDLDIDTESDSEQPGGFLRRWSRRKQAERARRAERGSIPPSDAEPAAASSAQAAGTAHDRSRDDPEPPALEALGEHDDYSAFLVSSKVTEELKHMALRKLFRSTKFNVCDGLDDYAEDYRSLTVLTDALSANLERRVTERAPGSRGDRAREAAVDDAPAPAEADRVARMSRFDEGAGEDTQPASVSDEDDDEERPAEARVASTSDEAIDDDHV